MVKQIKKKTLSFSINTLNIFLDINNEVNLEEIKDIDSISINKINDIKRNKLIIESFPDISNNLIKDTNGIDLIINVTNDINKKTAEENIKYEKTFRRKQIIITYILISICCLMFLLTTIMPGLINLFANQRYLVKYGEVYRLITSTFIHADILHLACNMYALYIFGNQIESFVGKLKFIFIYFISALVGSLISITFSTNFSVGASGAIFGLLGSLLYFGYHYRLYLGSVIKSQIIPIIVLNLIIGFSVQGIDNFAHIGGLIGGLLATMAVGIENKSDKIERINGWVVLTILLAFLIYFNIFR